MDRMLVVVFDNEKKAYEGRSALLDLEREGSLSIYAGAVVFKQADGSTVIREEDDFGPIATLVGTSVGSLIGLLGGPVGMAIGAASGLALGGLFDLDNARVGMDFTSDVAASLAPNRVAVIAEVDEEWTTPVDTRMEALGGTVFRRALWEVRDTLREEDIAAMKADFAELKKEIQEARNERRAKLQAKSKELESRIEAKQKAAKEHREAFAQRQKSKREVLKKNAAAAAHALKELVETPV